MKRIAILYVGMWAISAVIIAYESGDVMFGVKVAAMTALAKTAWSLLHSAFFDRVLMRRIQTRRLATLLKAENL